MHPNQIKMNAAATAIVAADPKLKDFELIACAPPRGDAFGANNQRRPWVALYRNPATNQRQTRKVDATVLGGRELK